MTTVDDVREPIPLSDAWVGIVDDDASVRTALARALRGHGIRTETFESAEEFLRCSVAGTPECIVLDIHLAGMSGFELQDVLGSRGAGPPIVFITGHDDLLSQRARIESACGYLRKPFAISALVALLLPHLDAALLD